MARAAKIAITLDQELLKKVEVIQNRTHESRSAVIARAIIEFLKIEQHRRDVDRYKQAYLEEPETADDLRMSRTLAKRSLRRVRWDEP